MTTRRPYATDQSTHSSMLCRPPACRPDNNLGRSPMQKLVTYLLATVLVPSAMLLAGVSETSAQVQTRTLRFTAASNKGHPQVLGVEKLAELVGQKRGGKITVRPFPGGQLGPDIQVVSAMQGGTIDLNVMNASLLAGNVKEMAALDLPFLFNSSEEADAVIDGPIGKK